MSQQDDKTLMSPTRTRLLTKNQHRVALLLAGLPLGLGLVLFVLNPSYMGAMFKESCGCMMVVVIFICVGAAYIALLGSFALSNKLEPPSWLMHGITLRLFLVGSVIALCVFPAVLLVLLGPAVLVIMHSGVLGTVP